MINVCSLDVLWVSLLFFFSFEPSAPNYSLPYNFYDSKICFFVLSRAWDQEDIVFSRGLRIFFSVPFSRQDKKGILLFFYRPRKLQRYLSFKSRVQIPYTPEFFSGLIFTTAQVVNITAMITFIHVFIRSSNI